MFVSGRNPFFFRLDLSVSNTVHWRYYLSEPERHPLCCTSQSCSDVTAVFETECKRYRRFNEKRIRQKCRLKDRQIRELEHHLKQGNGGLKRGLRVIYATKGSSD